MLRRIMIAAALLSLAVPACASPAAGPIAEIRAADKAAHLYVPLDKGQLLHLDQPYKRVSVGTRDVADVQPMFNGLLYVLGKKVGSTNLTFRDEAGAVVSVVDVIVTSVDVSGLVARLKTIMPDENIEIAPSGDGIVLDGPVSSPDHLRQAMAIAERFAPGKVTNMMSLSGSQQVLLEVKFAEVARTALKHVSTATDLKYLAGGSAAQILTGPAFPIPINTATTFGGIAGSFTNGNYDLQAGFEALERKGLIRTLAEPNLVALSGDTASFLAGGEFPIPVAQGGPNSSYSTVTVEYKDYGVGLAFTPTVVSKELVNLSIRSEVSSIDDSLAVKANGFDIPALKTRRAKTTVELRDGQSFAIAGLLQDDFANATEQLPVLGNIPILGALFRSPNFKHNQTDLVIFITVHLVQPTMAANLRTPLDTLRLPSQGEHFGVNGNVERGAAPADDKATTEKRDNEGYVLP